MGHIASCQLVTGGELQLLPWFLFPSSSSWVPLSSLFLGLGSGEGDWLFVISSPGPVPIHLTLQRKQNRDVISYHQFHCLSDSLSYWLFAVALHKNFLVHFSLISIVQSFFPRSSEFLCQCVF